MPSAELRASIVPFIADSGVSWSYQSFVTDFQLIEARAHDIIKKEDSREMRREFRIVITSTKSSGSRWKCSPRAINASDHFEHSGQTQLEMFASGLER